ncbi:MAG: polysaccharide deacetylase family protein, partial [Conexibacter sp.]|nr:polysaccharide deacetylase family protein [Conexibacter sp.]
MPRRALLLLVLVVLAGCGSSGGPGPATTRTAPPAGQVANGPDHVDVAIPDLPLGHSRAPVPILMYHVIAPPPPGAKYPNLWVAPAELREQVAALARAGFHGVTLDAVLDGWAGKDTLP